MPRTTRSKGAPVAKASRGAKEDQTMYYDGQMYYSNHPFSEQPVVTAVTAKLRKEENLTEADLRRFATVYPRCYLAGKTTRKRLLDWKSGHQHAIADWDTTLKQFWNTRDKDQRLGLEPRATVIPAGAKTTPEEDQAARQQEAQAGAAAAVVLEDDDDEQLNPRSILPFNPRVASPDLATPGFDVQATNEAEKGSRPQSGPKTYPSSLGDDDINKFLDSLRKLDGKVTKLRRFASKLDDADDKDFLLSLSRDMTEDVQHLDRMRVPLYELLDGPSASQQSPRNKKRGQGLIQETEDEISRKKRTQAIPNSNLARSLAHRNLFTAPPHEEECATNQQYGTRQAYPPSPNAVSQNTPGFDDGEPGYHCGYGAPRAPSTRILRRLNYDREFPRQPAPPIADLGRRVEEPGYPGATIRPNRGHTYDSSYDNRFEPQLSNSPRSLAPPGATPFRHGPGTFGPIRSPWCDEEDGNSPRYGAANARGLTRNAPRTESMYGTPPRPPSFLEQPGPNTPTPCLPPAPQLLSEISPPSPVNNNNNNNNNLTHARDSAQRGLEQSAAESLGPMASPRNYGGTANTDSPSADRQRVASQRTSATMSVASLLSPLRQNNEAGPRPEAPPSAPAPAPTPAPVSSLSLGITTADGSINIIHSSGTLPTSSQQQQPQQKQRQEQWAQLQQQHKAESNTTSQPGPREDNKEKERGE